MLVTALVSTYNAQKFIKGRLENLVEQTLYQKGDLEIIIIDSGSQQDEKQIVREFITSYKNINYFRTEERETVYEAWNRGLKLSQGFYFVNANTDDRFAKDGLEVLTSALETEPEFAAAYGDWYYTFTENDSFSSSTPKEFYPYPDFYPPLLFYHQLTSHALMIKRETFKEIGLFADGMEVCGDRDWVFRLAASGRKALHLKKVVGLYLKRGDSLERSRQSAANREFSKLLNFYIEPENFIRLHGRVEIPEKQEFAELYAKTGSLGINFLKKDKNGIETLPQQSLMFLRRALTLDPNNLMALNNMAVVAATQGGQRFAEESFSRLLAIDAVTKTTASKNLALSRSGSRRITDYGWFGGATEQRLLQ